MFVVIGTTTADLFVFSPTPFAHLGGDGFRAGNLIFTEQPLTMLMGGNGGNCAYILSGLGVPTALCSAVGQDPLGETLLDWLAARRVNLAGVWRSDRSATSTSTIIMSDAANQAVFHHLGATQEISLAHIPETLLVQAELLLATSFSIVPQMRAGGFAQALAITHQAGGLTALDIGPAIGRPVTLAELALLLPQVDYLLGNSHELAALTGQSDWETASRRLIEAGARRVVIKRGDQGAAVRGQDLEVDAPGFAVKTHISVGAGDAFNAGFLYGVKQGWPLAEATRFGNAVAALTISGERGVLGGPSLAEVGEFLVKGVGSRE
jgi:sugar/nucleoside kinase (ribokinase family)